MNMLLNKLSGTLFLSALLLTLCSCYRTIQVDVDTYINYKKAHKGFPDGSSFCLASKQDNNLLNNEIKLKLESALTSAGYQIKDRNVADYYLVFNYEVDRKTGIKANLYVQSQQVLNFMYYISNLSLTVFDAKAYRADSTKEEMLWQGSAVHIGEINDLRSIVDYLITALMPNFGKVTNKVKNYNFTEIFGAEHKDVKKLKKQYQF